MTLVAPIESLRFAMLVALLLPFVIAGFSLYDWHRRYQQSLLDAERRAGRMVAEAKLEAAVLEAERQLQGADRG